MTSIVAALSGGVDSAVAALLAARSGSLRASFTMRLSDSEAEAPGRCCAVSDVRDARLVAAALGVPHYVVDLRERFEREVVEPFVRAYVTGRTPIPCVACNDRLKFEELTARARALGADRVATGHYARIRREGARSHLLRARDRAKDQTYFLAGLTQAQLRDAEFPLGDLEKAQVRELAREAGLHVAAKPESQEICFVPDGDVASFVERRAPDAASEGDLVDRDGAIVGRHRGVHAYTVGQRRGLGAFGAPTYVLELRAAANEVVVGSEEELRRRVAIVERFSWISGEPPAHAVEADVQVRHAPASARALVTPRGEGVVVEFESPQRAIAPGQQAVAYAGDEVLGGGPVTSAA